MVWELVFPPFLLSILTFSTYGRGLEPFALFPSSLLFVYRIPSKRHPSVPQNIFILLQSHKMNWQSPWKDSWRNWSAGSSKKFLSFAQLCCNGHDATRRRSKPRKYSVLASIRLFHTRKIPSISPGWQRINHGFTEKSVRCPHCSWTLLKRLLNSKLFLVKAGKERFGR